MAARFWGVTCWSLAGALAVFSGLQGDLLYTFLIMHMVAILIFGFRSVPLFVALAAASGITMILLEAAGQLPPPLLQVPENFNPWIVLNNILLAGMVLWLAIGSLEEMVAEGKRSRKSLARKNEELEKIREKLERAFEERTRRLREANESLSVEVEERRRAELHLETALEAAEAAAQAKSSFLANMSHEIRTPLNGVLGLAEILLTGSVEPREQASLVRALQTSGKSLLTILDDILDLSKLEAGRFVIKNYNFDLHELVGDVLDSFARDALQKGIELVADLQGTPRSIQSDPVRLRQVLVNLVGNAIKFTNAGTVTVRVRWVAADQLQFQVQDTGIGISKEDQARLFQPFGQLDPSKTREFGGTGLGLAICRRLTELLGGEIQVESAVGQGSIFTFTIHVRLRPVAATETTGVRGRQAWLLAEANEARTILVDLLKAEGLTVRPWDGVGVPADVFSNDVLLVSDALADHVPEGILEEMNERSGPSLLLASIADLDARRRCEALGLGAVLGQPVTPGRLKATLRAVSAVGEVREAEITENMTPFQAIAPLSILLAEDNEVNRIVATKILEVLGYQPDVVVDGEEVLRALERKPYDVILMDLMMPKLDGLEATRQIRRHPPEGVAPHVIAVTASVLPEEQERCREAGMDDFLSKPLQLSAVRAALLRCFHAREEDRSGSGTGSRTSTVTWGR